MIDLQKLTQPSAVPPLVPLKFGPLSFVLPPLIDCFPSPFFFPHRSWPTNAHQHQLNKHSTVV